MTFSPFELLYGRTVRGSMVILKELWSSESTDIDTRQMCQNVFELRNRIEDTCKAATHNLETSQLRYKVKKVELGVMEPSKYPYCSLMLLVQKIDGTYRPVVDFRQLNRATTFD